MDDALAAFRLDGRLAVVTGAASGIGREVAALYARAGARLVLTDVDPVRLDETAHAIGGRVTALPADLTDPQAIDDLAERAGTEGAIDVWANVAGVAAAMPAMEATPDFYERIRRINMDAVYWCCAAAARAMARQGRGAIINVSSNAADQPMAALSVYAMTKAAVNMLTRSLAVELGPRGIRVNGVAPGFTVTAMTAPDTLAPAERAALLDRNAARSPLGLVGMPDDVAHAMLYLASDASRFVTGQILRVNGGVAMP